MEAFAGLMDESSRRGPRTDLSVRTLRLFANPWSNRTLLPTNDQLCRDC